MRRELRQHQLADRQVARPLVRRVHHRPGRARPVRRFQNVQRGALQPVVDPVMPPVLRRHPPRRVLVRLPALEARPLRVLVQVQPHLHHQRVVIDQRLLEIADALQILVQRRQVLLAPRLLRQRLRVPRARVDADLSAGRQTPPEPPQKRPPPLLLRRLLKRKRLRAARVQPAAERVQHVPAPRPRHARHDEQHLEGQLLQLHLQAHQLLAQLPDARLVGLLRDPRRLLPRRPGLRLRLWLGLLRLAPRAFLFALRRANLRPLFGG